MSEPDGMVEYGESTGPCMPAHFYFHVPFCRSKCSYCDFASVSGASPDVAFAVFTGIEAEVVRWGASALPGVVETVYVGGGTRRGVASCRTYSIFGGVAVAYMMRIPFGPYTSDGLWFTHQDKQKPRFASAKRGQLRGAFLFEGRLPPAHRPRLTALSKPP